MLAALAVLVAHGQPLTFDVVSVKPHRDEGSQPGRMPKAGGPAPVRDGFLIFRAGVATSGRAGITACGMILEAYRVTSSQLSGGPAWLSSDSFDLEAKAADAGPAELRTMLQTMLAERFHLVVKQRQESLAVYSIVLSKGELKLREWKQGDPIPMPAESHAMNYRGAGTMQEFAAFLSNDPHVGRPVLDRTGLTGLYLHSFGWDADDEYLSSIQSQLGLKLVAGKETMGVLVVEHIEKPVGN
jgi:uncharacterized protein (TIGR03435 family)